MTRGGRDKDRSGGAERKCIATGALRPQSALLRFVADPDGQVVPDITGRLPGRGLWLSPDRAALNRAMKKNLFARSAKTPLTVPEALPDWIEQGLVAKLVQTIALARKAGQAVCGFEKVKTHLATQPTGALLQASDGSTRGKSKLWTPQGARFVGCLTSSELGLAFGRDSVIHAALASGTLSRQVIEDAAKLSGFRQSDTTKRDKGPAATGDSTADRKDVDGDVPRRERQDDA